MPGSELAVAALWLCGIASGVTLTLLSQSYRAAHDRGWQRGFADGADDVFERRR